MECEREIQYLCSVGVIVETEHRPDQFLSSYFLIDKKLGGKRFILNLKNLNEYINPSHFQMKSLTTEYILLSRDNFMATVHLQDAYFMVPIHNIIIIEDSYVFLSKR